MLVPSLSTTAVSAPTEKVGPTVIQNEQYKVSTLRC